jgi:hypothetical protein
MFESLANAGFQIAFESHAEAILATDFAPAVAELEAALAATSIPIEEIIAGGGGEAKGTQRLRRALARAGWSKTVFRIQRSIQVGESEDRLGPPELRESQSHIVDHVRSFSDHVRTRRIALEIEWNNKDPFFDRDLENFKRLHADGAISLGIVVTRGTSLHLGLRGLVERYLRLHEVRGFDDLARIGALPTPRQRAEIERAIGKRHEALDFADAFARMFANDKFSHATTHWGKLEDRLRRGVGNPCPLVLIGLPDSVIVFDGPLPEEEEEDWRLL